MLRQYAIFASMFALHKELSHCLSLSTKNIQRSLMFGQCISGVLEEVASVSFHTMVYIYFNIYFTVSLALYTFLRLW
jgi:hypothetical protein